MGNPVIAFMWKHYFRLDLRQRQNQYSVSSYLYSEIVRLAFEFTAGHFGSEPSDWSVSERKFHRIGYGGITAIYCIYSREISFDGNSFILDITYISLTIVCGQG